MCYSGKHWHCVLGGGVRVWVKGGILVVCATLVQGRGGEGGKPAVCATLVSTGG